MSPLQSAPSTLNSQLPSYNTGDTVEHTAFGRGIVKKVSPAGGDALLEIEFDTHGVKRLMLKSASRYMSKA
jgi:DNA helicase-2/ATP-dependent DNA helicase PcrA